MRDSAGAAVGGGVMWPWIESLRRYKRDEPTKIVSSGVSNSHHPVLAAGEVRGHAASNFQENAT
jgi:hypothetical protein